MPPDRARPAGDLPHPAGVADRDLLADLCAAADWWAAQRSWRATSSHTGGGVIAAFEEAVARRVGPGAHALALPSATAALTTALTIAGVRPGDRVGVPEVDWTATGAALRALRARAVPLPVDPQTGLLDASGLARRGLPRGLAAVVLVHLHGLTCDGPALRRAFPGLAIVEDAAQAWAAHYPGGDPVGSAAEACAFSFGATKSPSAGELGALVTRTRALHQAAVALTQHPTRQLLAGVECPRDDLLMTRVAPAAALLGAYAIQRHAGQVAILRRAAGQVAGTLREAGLTVLSDPALHAPGVIAVRATPADVRALLGHERLPGGLIVAAADRADVEARHQGTTGPAWDRGLTVVTVAAPR